MRHPTDRFEHLHICLRACMHTWMPPGRRAGPEFCHQLGRRHHDKVVQRIHPYSTDFQMGGSWCVLCSFFSAVNPLDFCIQQ